MITASSFSSSVAPALPQPARVVLSKPSEKVAASNKGVLVSMVKARSEYCYKLYPVTALTMPLYNFRIIIIIFNSLGFLVRGGELARYTSISQNHQLLVLKSLLSKIIERLLNGLISGLQKRKNEAGCQLHITHIAAIAISTRPVTS